MILCSAVWSFIHERYDRFHVHLQGKFTEVFTGTSPYDLLFLGSSKTHSNIHPGIIDSITGLHSYNAGVDGISLFEYRMILEAYLVHHPPPRIVVISFDLHSFHGRKEFYDPVPYLQFTGNRVVDTVLSAHGHPTLVFKLLPFLSLIRYHDDQKITEVLKASMGKTEIPASDFSYAGYLSNSDSVLRDPSFPVHAQEMTEGGRRLLTDILDLSIRRGIQPVLIYPPEYQSRIFRLTPNSHQILQVVSEVAEARQVPLWRHEGLPLCDSAIYFRNTGHLNKAGARVYSRFLASELDSFIQQKGIATVAR